MYVFPDKKRILERLGLCLNACSFGRLGLYKRKVRVVTLQVLCKITIWIKTWTKDVRGNRLWECVPMNTKSKRTNRRTKPPRHEENTSGGQIGNWIINYKELRLSSAGEEKRDEMEVAKRKERASALNKSCLPLSCPCRNSRCATWLKFPGLIAVK